MCVGTVSISIISYNGLHALIKYFRVFGLFHIDSDDRMTTFHHLSEICFSLCMKIENMLLLSWNILIGSVFNKCFKNTKNLIQILEYSNTVFVFEYSDPLSNIRISEYSLPSIIVKHLNIKYLIKPETYNTLQYWFRLYHIIHHILFVLLTKLWH